MGDEFQKSELRKLYHMTPGPQYMLPSTVGTTNVDVTIKKSPAYSLAWRYRHPSQKKDFTPGSIVYNCSGMNRNCQTKIKGGFLGVKIQGPRISYTPSLHVYYPEYKANSMYRKAPSSSLGCKRREPKFLKITPGANAYFIPSSIGANVPFLKSSPAYSQLGKSKQKAKSFYVPPPSEYDLVKCDLFKKKTPEYSIKGRKSDAKYRPLIPAPNAYFPTKFCMKNSPSFCFGVKQKCVIPKFSMDNGDEKITILPDDLDPY